MVPSTTTATGVVGRRPAATEGVGDGRAVVHAHQDDHGATHPTQRVPGDQGIGVTGGQVAGDDGELVSHAAMGDGDADAGGDGDGGGQAWYDGHRHVGGCTGQHLLEAAPEHEVVATLEAHHSLAGASALDDDLVDVVLGGRASTRELGHVDQLDLGAELVEELAGRQSVGDHDVRRRERVPGGDGHELRLTGTPADEHHAGGAVVRAVRREVAVAQGGDDVVAQVGRLAGLPVAEHADGDAAVVADRRRPRGATQGVVRAYAEGVAPSAAATTRALTSGSSVAATTYHAPSTSASSNARSTRVISLARPSSAGVTSGLTTVTSAFTARKAGTRRWATWPPPTTTTLRPASTSPAR